MTSLISVFVLSLMLSMLLTPVVAIVARRLRILDAPSGRKVHEAATPRAGGVAVYVAFTLVFLAAAGLPSLGLDAFTLDHRIPAFLFGGTVAFALGLWDDLRTLPPGRKFAGHIAAGCIAYLGGIQILRVSLPPLGAVSIGWLSFPVTVLWFVLIINALNLIDGLDGLATGITLFAALILLMIVDTSGRFLAAVGLAALAGASLGFLRHNFHPASIFLGDSGSYFLGYSLAALSILGSVKSETTVAILIPIIALGVPVIDALWAPIRRFILGRRLFHPDRDHIHHRLLKLGYTHRRAVLILYAATIVMGLGALALVHARDVRAALILLSVGIGVFVGIRKLGYLGFVDRRRLVGWLATISDDLGLRRNRRSFLECQEVISQATTLVELRGTVASAAQFLALDFCDVTVAACATCGHERCEFRRSGEARPDAVWDPNQTLQVSLPLVHQGTRVGCLRVSQQINEVGNPYLLRRIDQLRGTIAETLFRMHDAHRSTDNGARQAAVLSPGNGQGAPARLLFFTHYFPPEGNAPATRVHQICRQWVSSGHRVTVITCAPNVPNGIVYDGYTNRWRQREVIDGIDTVRVWTYLAANKGTARRIVNYLSYMIAAVIAGCCRPAPDVMIATSPQFFCGWAGVIASWLRRVPFVLEIRDLWPESIVTVGAMRNRRLVRLLEWLELRMYAAADHIVTVGDGYRDQLCARGVPREKISVIANGVDRDIFVPREGDPQLREQWGLGRRFLCAYVGTIGMACGLDTVLRAGQLLQAKGRTDIAFLVVGDGAVRVELQRAAQRSGLDNVIFTGRQDKRVIPDILASVDACLVHLKKRELFTTVMPSKIFEAAAMAKPIILGLGGHAADLVQQAGCGICIEPENEHALVAAVEKLADDPRLGSALGRNGHDFFVQRFDRRTLAQQYLELVLSIHDGAMRGGQKALGARGNAAEPTAALVSGLAAHGTTHGSNAAEIEVSA